MIEIDGRFLLCFSWYFQNTNRNFAWFSVSFRCITLANTQLSYLHTVSLLSKEQYKPIFFLFLSLVRYLLLFSSLFVVFGGGAAATVIHCTANRTHIHFICENGCSHTIALSVQNNMKVCSLLCAVARALFQSYSHSLPLPLFHVPSQSRKRILVVLISFFVLLSARSKKNDAKWM